ncbi:flagellar protein FliS [Methylomagnum ishizawai]|uniref:Flagellar secretion chaperone FliS n=1 Tax=Methylomagnum ishizawai TaxID=1760988 RepID=A0A1Y6CYH1_9GAMM|nr:flagellar export chaperone FliS [Methylomagnum ishizawai]SMF95718.1 flagellar protein FliS [Methylomagnum ishizawai]
MKPAHYALREYQQNQLDAGVAYADPHTLIAMLFDGLQDRIAVAKGSIGRGAYGEKARVIGNAIEILNYLQSCLDPGQGGDIAINLDRLYGYMIERLFLASSRNDIAMLDEVGDLVREIKEGWDGIREVVRAGALS